ncbi:hybrid sensor histidine kinase/response regulator [Pseudorhodoferax sp. Leaf265]|uniref:hybrid sensor histidine kinase/response regulator n=1 Tax=Pseudorhodoferax sp. Leaf265 TaxID=1736315 RepID=UPI0012E8F8FF|nr:hybrid sensor histidine kinase/response regulator [Pseudorhodoferax sp. Leaf265]
MDWSKWMGGALLVLAAGVLLVIAVLRVREARKALHEARSALTARNQFLGMMAHEMLTPLQTIVSSVELIELGGKVPQGDETFRRLRRSAQQLEAQMNDTVEFARLSGGRLKVSPTLFQPDLMMELIAAEFDEAARERGVVLKVQIDPQPCPRVVTDPARLRQIVANLVSNAVKYASPGEVVCSIQVREAQREVTVAVIDQGPGFDTSVNIWEPFTRGRDHVQMGSGLGLAVVKLMAELLGGRAFAVSRPGEGSAFTVRVPAEVEARTRSAVAQGDGRHLRVLVVEDDPDVRASLHAMLLALGAQADLADSVREARLLLDTDRYDGVLLDLRLPDGSGYTVAEHARRLGALNAETPLVALSAYHEADATADALFAAKFDKPISAGRLRSALALFGGGSGTSGWPALAPAADAAGKSPAPGGTASQ